MCRLYSQYFHYSQVWVMFRNYYYNNIDCLIYLIVIHASFFVYFFARWVILVKFIHLHWFKKWFHICFTEFLVLHMQRICRRLGQNTSEYAAGEGVLLWEYIVTYSYNSLSFIHCTVMLYWYFSPTQLQESDVRLVVIGQSLYTHIEVSSNNLHQI